MKEPSILLDPLREKFAAKQLTGADIEAWQNALWKFSNIGHIGRAKGPKAWQEPASPLVSQQELRVKLDGNRDHTVYLVGGTAGDGGEGDKIIWDNPRLVAKGRPDFPIAQLPELVKHLETDRTKILASTESALSVLAGGKAEVDASILARWQDYLGFGGTKLEPLMTKKLLRSPDYAFISGWTGDRDLSILANSSDGRVRIPGTMEPHSIATHPAPIGLRLSRGKARLPLTSSRSRARSCMPTLSVATVLPGPWKYDAEPQLNGLLRVSRKDPNRSSLARSGMSASNLIKWSHSSLAHAMGTTHAT